jgi:hypothetical protein
MVPAIPAVGIEPDSGYHASITVPEIPAINRSEINETAAEDFRKSPEPVTIFKAEVSETALPGPRYMAFGPSVIGISVSPIILSALIVLVFLGIAAWCIRTCSRREYERKE